MAGMWQVRSAPADADLIRAIAVLPLANLAATDQDYFADGMTDALITEPAALDV